jgi:hypothetical protein
LLNKRRILAWGILMSRSPIIIAVLDANVLYPAPLRYESIIWNLSLPDPDDRHVLAAAIKSEARVIVTANLKDFPSAVLAPYAIRAEHPDEFVSGCIDRERQKAIKALKNQVKALQKPPLSLEKVLENLEGTGLIRSVAKLKS